MKILNLTTHLKAGGISAYLAIVGSEMVRRGHSVMVASSGGEFKPRLESKGVRCIDFPIRTKNAFHPKLWLTIPKICGLAKEEKVDILHAHSRVTQVLGSWVSRFTGVPLVTTAHGFFKRNFGRRVFGAWGCRTIAISPLVAEELEKTHKLKRAQIRIVSNAIDFDEFEERLAQKDPVLLKKEMGIPEKSKVLSCISRLVRDKGQEYLIEALAKLKKKYPDIFLVLVGNGRERKNLEALMKKLSLEKNLSLLPTELDITRILAVSDVFVHPATYREGFGLAILEAMAAMVPVVATNIWALNTIIRDHVNGFLVEPKKSDEIVKAVDFIFENPMLAEKVARNGYEIAKDLYSIDRLASELETVYSEVLWKKNSKV